MHNSSFQYLNLELVESIDPRSFRPHWHQFIKALRSDAYRKCICQLLGTRNVDFSYQWHYAPRGSSIPPHCDTRRKIGTHMFDMNSATDWKHEWGGQTLILDDHGKFHRDSNPSIDSFPDQVAASICENSSLIFGRGNKSWHAVRELTCPDGAYRKVFLVRFEKVQPIRALRKKLIRFVKGKEFNAPEKNAVY
jgi:hypothetical protein